MRNQMKDYMEEYLSPFIFGYRKSYGPQPCLLSMIEMWRKGLDEGKVAGAILTDLSKAFEISVAKSGPTRKKSLKGTKKGPLFSEIGTK